MQIFELTPIFIFFQEYTLTPAYNVFGCPTFFEVRLLSLLVFLHILLWLSNALVYYLMVVLRPLMILVFS